MIVNHETPRIESSNLPTKQFTINITAHAFDVLISKQYKNKPESIIREILSNALDAHIEANQTRPVEVTLPTFVNPTLTIKDFGTGISPKNIDDVYTVLFESTRNTTNAFRGGFGLGCKVPFAYADQFTVETRWQGTCYDYVMYRDSSSIPTCALIAETPTLEPNGVTVSIAIDPDDIPKFRAAADRILPWFGDQLAANIPITPLPTIWKGPTAEIVNVVYYLTDTNFVARIGNVIYPIPDTITREILQTCTNANFIPYGRFLVGAVIVLDFPIGALQVTPSREDLIHSDAATLAIKEAITTFIVDIRTWLTDQDIADPLTAAKQLLPLKKVLQPMRIWPDTVCKQQHELFSNVLFTIPTNWAVHQVEIYYPHQNNHAARLRTVKSPHTGAQIQLYIDEPLTVLYTDDPKYLPARVKDAPVSGTRNRTFVLIVTNDTPATIKTALTPYNMTPITLLPLASRTPCATTPRERSPARPKTVLYDITHDIYETPTTNPFYVLGIDRPVPQYKKAALIDYPNTHPNQMLHVLRDLKHLVPHPDDIPSTVYIYGPAQRASISKNPAARELKPLLDSLIPQINTDELHKRDLRNAIYARLENLHHNTAYKAPAFIHAIPTDNPLCLPAKLRRLSELYPTSNARDYNTTKQVLNLQTNVSPSNHETIVNELMNLLTHYTVFIEHNMNPSDPRVMDLIIAHNATLTD